MKNTKRILVGLLVALTATDVLAAPVVTRDLMGLGMSAPLAEKVAAIGNAEAPATSVQWGVDGTTELTLTNDKLTFSGTTASVQTGGILQMLNSTAGVMWQFQDDGDLVGNSTNQGNVILDAQDKGLYILSGAGPAVDADVTTAASAGTSTAYITSNTSGNNFNFVANIADAVGSTINFFKTRAAVNATNANTIVANADVIGQLVAQGADGADFSNAAAIQFIVEGTPGTNDMPGAVRIQTSPDGSETLATVATFSNDKSVTLTGTLASTRTTDLGWSIVNAANQACNTTCTSACVLGFNTGALGNLLSCSDATADSCLCAGGS